MSIRSTRRNAGTHGANRLPGALVGSWQYIQQMRESRERSEADLRRQLSDGGGGGAAALGAAAGVVPPHSPEELAGSTVLELTGHLFDSNLLSSVLDLIEARSAPSATARPNSLLSEVHDDETNS